MSFPKLGGQSSLGNCMGGPLLQESVGNVLHAAMRRQSAEFAATGRSSAAAAVPVTRRFQSVQDATLAFRNLYT